MKQYPLILYTLIDNTKRHKLERICNSLDKKIGAITGTVNLLDLIHYSTTHYVPMRKVKELLEATNV